MSNPPENPISTPGLPISFDMVPDEIIIPETVEAATEPPPDIDERIREMERMRREADPLQGLKSSDIKNCLFSGQDGDADLFIRIFKDKYVFDHAAGWWYYWNDHHWRQDKIDQVVIDTKQVIDVYSLETDRLFELREKQEEGPAIEPKTVKATEALYKAYLSRIQKLHSLDYKKKVLGIARSGVGSLGIPGDNWDQNPWLLPVRNGVVDLKTGEFRSGRPDDYIKTVAPTPWEDIKTPCSAWESFLLSICDNDVEMVAYLQRLFGYAITGLTTENIYPIFWGEHGQNGKGTMIETIGEVLGEKLAFKGQSDSLIQKNAGLKQSHDAELMRYRGARIVWYSETNKNARFDVAQIKEKSGSDTLSARPPYGRDQIQFKPSHLMFIITNRRPILPADDNALWLRTHLISFLLSFVENPQAPHERKRDKALIEKLRKEFPGILAWLVRGCLMWQKYGICPPEKVVAATSNYRDSEDIFQDFLNDCTYKSKESETKQAAFFPIYKQWCLDNGFSKMNKKHFLEELQRKLGEPKRGTISNTMVYHGVALFD